MAIPGGLVHAFPQKHTRIQVRLVDLIESNRDCQTVQSGRMIITSVDLISAAAIWPFFSRSSRTASAVMMEVMCCPPTERVTCASNPLVLMSVMRPTSWLRPLMRRNVRRRFSGVPDAVTRGKSRSTSDSGMRWCPPAV